jgi:hypothetical protein
MKQYKISTELVCTLIENVAKVIIQTYIQNVNEIYINFSNNLTSY